MHKHTNKKADPRTRNLRIGQCVFVQWEDYRALDISAAQDQALDCTRCASVGWIVRKTDRAVALIPSANARDGIPAHHSNSHILIPISSITRVARVPLPFPFATRTKSGEQKKPLELIP
jgi:hypothetical protein